MEENKKRTLSYSKLSLFNKCPYAYYWKYVVKDQSPETTWPGGLFGTTVHAMLEVYIGMLNTGASHTEAEAALKNRFSEFFSKERNLITKPKIFKESREFRSDKAAFFESGDKAVIAVIRFFDKYFNGHYRQIESEAEYKASWDDTTDTTGIIDIRLTMPDDSIEIIDMKVTGDSANFWWTDWQSDPQSNMYDFLTFKSLGIIPSKFAYLVYDRNINVLFMKQRLIPVNTPETLKNGELAKMIASASAFHEATISNPELAESLARPTELQCKWCSFSKLCSKKWESRLAKSGKAAMKNRRTSV